MKAKKQKLVKSVLEWMDKKGKFYFEQTKEEIQNLLDEFIDKHDSKKKSKFGSDKEQVKLKEEPKEKTFEEWTAITMADKKEVTKQKLWEMAAHIVKCQKAASKTNFDNVDVDMLTEDWFDWLESEILGEEEEANITPKTPTK